MANSKRKPRLTARQRDEAIRVIVRYETALQPLRTTPGAPRLDWTSDPTPNAIAAWRADYRAWVERAGLAEEYKVVNSDHAIVEAHRDSIEEDKIAQDKLARELKQIGIPADRDIDLTPDQAIWLKLGSLAVGIERLRERLAGGDANAADREAAHTLLRAEYGIPDSPPQAAQVLGLTLSAWIAQARAERNENPAKASSYSGAWLKNQALALSPQFANVPADRFNDAIAPAPNKGPVPADTKAADLVCLAGLYTDPAGLVRAMYKLRSESKPGR